MKHIIFLIIPLAIGLGIGYWLLITANAQKDALKNIGNILGGFLIALTFLASFFGFYFFSQMDNEYQMERMMPPMYCHHHHHHHSFYQNQPNIDDEGFDEENEPERIRDNRDIPHKYNPQRNK